LGSSNAKTRNGFRWEATQSYKDEQKKNPKVILKKGEHHLKKKGGAKKACPFRGKTKRGLAKLNH